MKSFKKGIALIAVLAFLITAALPVAGLAADVTPRIEPQTMTAGEAKVIEIPGGFANTTTPGVTSNGRYSVSGEPAIQSGWITVSNADETGNTQILTISIPAGAAGFDTVGGPYEYTVLYTRNGSSVNRPVATFELTVIDGTPAETFAVTAGEGVASAEPAEAAEGATVTVTPNKPAAGNRVTAVTATMADGTVINAVRQQNGTWTFTMPAGAVTVTATTTPAGTLYQVKLADGTSGNDVEIAAGEADEGFYADETVTLSIAPVNDTELVPTTITVTNDTTNEPVQVTLADQANSEYTFTMPASDVTVAVTYAEPTTSDVATSDGITTGVTEAANDTQVTVTLPEGVNPDDVWVVGADGTRYPLQQNADGTWYFTMPNQAVSITNGEPEPGPDIPALTVPGIITGADYLAGTSGYDPFKYWTQPKAGLFNDGEVSGTDARPTTDVPVNRDAEPDRFQIGPDGLGTPGVALSPSGYTDTLDLNSRVQIYYSPRNISVNDEDGNLIQLNGCNWEEYVTMEWEYKPSTNNEDDGNPLKIPAGFGFSGVRSPLLTISPLTANMDGWWVRLAVYPKGANSSLYWTTRWIRLDIDGVNGALDPDVTLTSNPEAVGSMVNVTRGGEAVLTAIVNNQPYGSTNEYQWQSLAVPTAANPTPQWANVTGANDQSLNLNNVTDALSGISYRCQVTCRESGPNSPAPVVTSNSLTLNVTDSDGSVYIEGSSPDGSTLIYKLTGDRLAAAIMARTDNGDPMTYQWYVRSYLAPVPSNIDSVPQAAAYLAGAAAEPIEGATGASLTSAPLQEGVYGFSCRVENANNPAKSANSPVIYVVVTDTQIDVYPVPGTIHSVGTVNGQSLTLSAHTRVTDVTYTWERYNAASDQWTPLTATGKTLTLPQLTTTATGTLYRCAISVPGSTTPVYTGWYLINVWDTANTPQITYTQPNLQWTQNQLTANYKDLELKSTARIAQNLGHGLGPVVAVWYNAAGEAVAVHSSNQTVANDFWTALQAHGQTAPNNAWFENTALVSESSAGGTFTSSLKLNSALTIDEDGVVTLPDYSKACETSATLGRALNGTYHCVWYKPQTNQEWLDETAFIYGYDGNSTNSSVIERWMHDNLRLLAPQGTKGTTKIQIQIPGDPWIVTDLNDELEVAVGQKATLSVAAAITPPADGATPVYTWQVSKDGEKTWSNCLSTDGTGQFTTAFTTRTITQEDFDSNTRLSYRVIVASRPNVAKIVSNTCSLTITEGTPQAPAITPGPGSTITVENGVATGVTVSKTGTTVEDFLGQLNMTVPAGYSLRVVGSDDQVLASDAIVYTGCVLQLINDADGSVADRATIIVAGDVLGTGIIAINQVVRMAQDLNGTRALEGIFQQAGDFNGSGSIDIADLVREAQILAEPVDVQ